MLMRLHRPLLIFVVIFAVAQVLHVIVAVTAGDAISSTSYLLHTGGLLIITLYVVHTQSELGLTKEKVAVYRELWARLPFAALITKQGQPELVNDSFTKLISPDGDDAVKCHNSDLLCPFTECLVEKALAMRETQVREERLDDAKGGSKFVRRYAIPAVLGKQCHYAAEIILNLTPQSLMAANREQDYRQMLTILVNMFEMKDPYGQGHSQTVCNLAQELGTALNLSPEEMEVLATAAILHDIGKIVIPANILSKMEPLTEDDYVIIRRHPIVSADIVEGIAAFQAAAPIIRHHHERYDGQGYPDGLCGEEIPLGSRILAVVDAFDAMTVGRTYRGKADVNTAIDNIIREKGRQFDPVVVDAFTVLVKTGRAQK